jgi:cellulose synthase/poly-beta-1,6-N-acetylglucosamine synthase-like glycosyltransferase
MTLVAWLFCLSAVWLGYVWLGYPLVLEVLSLTRRFRSITANDYHPTVSVLIAARNEQKDIAWKLAETLAWDYPPDRLEVLVGSDASTDGTDQVIASFRDPRLRFLRNGERAGKSITLNRLARLASGELLFFTDANTHIEPQCLRKMVRHFADLRVGCVTGMQRNVTEPETSMLATGSNAYVEYESAVDTLESKLGSVLVCDGSVYCLRRALFTDLDPDLANDLEHPVRVGGAGAAVLYEPLAQSAERCTSSVREEFARRRRIAAQGALAMWRLRRELHGLRLWQFVSRKFLRWLTLLPLTVALVTSFLLRQEALFAVLFAVQMAFWTLALAGVWQPDKSRVNSMLRLPFVFLLGNIAVFVGVLDASRRKTFATWNIAELSRGPNAQGG